MLEGVETIKEKGMRKEVVDLQPSFMQFSTYFYRQPDFVRPSLHKA